MKQLIAAVLLLMLGGALCLLPASNRLRASLGLASQALATLLVSVGRVSRECSALPAQTLQLPWSYPIGGAALPSGRAGRRFF